MRVIVVEKSNKGPISVMLLEFGVQGWGSCCPAVSWRVCALLQTWH